MKSTHSSSHNLSLKCPRQDSTILVSQQLVGWQKSHQRNINGRESPVFTPKLHLTSFPGLLTANEIIHQPSYYSWIDMEPQVTSATLIPEKGTIFQAGNGRPRSRDTGLFKLVVSPNNKGLTRSKSKGAGEYPGRQHSQCCPTTNLPDTPKLSFRQEGGAW